MLLAQGQSVQQAARQIEVTEQTCYRWLEGVWWSSGGSGETIASVERENIRLKRLVAEKELDIHILKETLAVDAKTSEPGEATGHLYTALEISQHRACTMLGVPRSTHPIGIVRATPSDEPV